MDKVEKLAQEISAEQAADLAALHAAAANEVDPLAPPAPPPVDLAGELGGMVTMVVQVLAPAFPSLPKLYTDSTVRAASGAIAAVCTKRGWLAGGLMGGWGEEIACAAVVLPLAVATAQGIKADIAARKPAEQQAAPAAPVGQDSKTVTIGAVMMPAGSTS